MRIKQKLAVHSRAGKGLGTSVRFVFSAIEFRTIQVLITNNACYFFCLRCSINAPFETACALLGCLFRRLHFTFTLYLLFFAVIFLFTSAI